MKKTFLNISLVAAMVLTGSQQVFAKEKASKEKSELTEVEIQRFAEIEARIMEINTMDFSEMSREEKRDLRNEVKELNKESKTLRGGGLYISTGALIIILILLIILL